MIKAIRSVVKGSTAYLWVLGILGVVLSATSIWATNTFGGLTNSMVEGFQGSLAPVITLVAVLFALQCIVEFGYNTLRGKFLAQGRQSLQDACMNRLNRATVPWVQARGSGDILGSLQIELQGASELLCETLPDFIMQGVQVVMFCTMIMIIDWRLAAIYMLTIGLVVVVQTLLSKPIQGRNQDMQVKRGAALGVAREVVNQRINIKAYHAHSLALHWFNRLAQPWLYASVRAELQASPLRTIGWVLGIAPTFVLCITGAVLVQAGQLTFGAFMSVYFLADMMGNTCMHYVDLFVQFRKGQAAAKRLWEIVDCPAEMYESKTTLQPANNKPLLEVCGLSFAYTSQLTGDGTLVVDNVSFAVNQGERVAIVGSSGCGKSTILRLVEGFLQPKSGTLRLWGQDYNALGLDLVRTQLSFVPQSPFLFADTVEENVLLGKTNLGTGKMEKLYQKSAMNGFLHTLGQGDKTCVGEGGSGLSTGQSQRVAFARGLTKVAPLLILDEATSALDAQSDKLIFETIAALPKEQAVLAVTHRFTYLTGFDKIIVMEGGRIAEQGTHNQLVQAGGTYARLWNSQKEDV